MKTFPARDGVPLCSTVMAPAQSSPRGTVLLIHGFAQNRITWHSKQFSFAEHLAGLGYLVHLVEVRGAGRSGEAGAPYAESLADYVLKDLPAIVEELVLPARNGPVFALGHSIGGLLACSMAAWNPGLLTGVGAVASPGRMKFPRFLDPLVAYLGIRESLPLPASFRRKVNRAPFAMDIGGRVTATLIRAGFERLIPLKLKPWRTGGMNDDALVERVTDGFDRIGLGVYLELGEWAATGQLRIPGATEDLIARFADVDGPVLLVSSPLDVLAPTKASLAAEMFPDAAVTPVVVPDMGHCDILVGPEAPSKAWPKIADWLNSLS